LKKAIIIGASSGIGKELARLLAANGYTVAIIARRIHLLHDLQNQLPNDTIARQLDIANAESTINTLSELFYEMGTVDLVVLSAGTGDLNENLDWPIEQATIATNVTGFSAAANVAIKHFIKNRSGQLVAISSIAALRGGDSSPAYNASKAYMSNYLEGLRKKVTGLGLPIVITEIQPGFVATDMAKGKGLFWVAPLNKAAQQIYHAIIKNKTHAYITRRWRLVAWLLKAMPSYLYIRQ